MCLIRMFSLTNKYLFSECFLSFADFKDIDISLRGRLADRILRSVTFEMLRVKHLTLLDPFVGESISKGTRFQI